jgi:pyridoxal phosphate enzyme (YggS family)
VAVSDAYAAAIAARLAEVDARIAAACANTGRARGDVRLIAVTKGHGPQAIRAAYAAGQREFGENYVQELAAKAAVLGDLPELKLRFIGRLQRNKAKDVVKLGCSVDGVDSLALAQALSQRVAGTGRELEVLLQVNVDREPQKAGVLPEAVAELCAAVRELPGLSLRGLMAIPAAAGDDAAARASFRRVRELAAQLGLPDVSMGMSGDLELAIEEGATMVRVGTAIFGARPPR